MAHHILVIEYEPRYIERIEEAAAGSGFSTTVARTGDEAIQALPRKKYDLIVLSTIIPRYSTAQLIRSARNDSLNAATPVLLTTSGYSGADPRSDAVKLGATDMLVKPYAPPDFVQKVSTLLNLAGVGPGESDEETVRLSSRQIFGDLLDDAASSPTLEQSLPEEPEQTVPNRKASPPVDETSTPSGSTSSRDDEESSPEKKSKSSGDDLDQMLADTLAGVRLPSSRKKRKTTSSQDIDKLLENTLSGLEPQRKRESKSPSVEKPIHPADVPSEDATGEAAEPPGMEEPVPSESSQAPPVSRAESEPEPEPEPIQEEEPFPEPLPEPQAAAAEEDEPPFEGVEERPAAERTGTTLLGGESPPVPEGEQPRDEPAEDEEEGDASRFGQYVLLEKIATGGMAEVWKARMRGLEGFEKIVAIKKILPHLSDNDEFTEMFVDEAKLAAQLNHNNIIHIYDLGKIDESWFIAMEYIDGFDLKSLLLRGDQVGRKLPIPLALFIGSKIAAALDYAHRKKGFDDQELGLVHRDVSPQNVLISRDGDIKLCDFGIAKAATKASHTQAGALKGKLQYMSPEQAWGRHIDHRSDVFAASAVMFEMLAGRKLFSGDSEISVLDQVREAQVPSPSVYNKDVPEEIDQIVLKGLEKEPEARFQTAGEMARAIDSILYSYRPAPTSADLTLYVAAIESPEDHPMPAISTGWGEESPDAEASDPSVDTLVVRLPPAPEPEPVDTGASADDEDGEPTVVVPILEEERAEEELGERVALGSPLSGPEEKKKSRIVPILIAAILILGTVGVGAFMMFRGGEEGGPSTDAVVGSGATPPSTPAVPDEGLPVEDRPVAGDAVTPEGLAEEQLGEGASALGEEDLALIDQAVHDRVEAERQRMERERQDQSRSQRPTPSAQTEPAAARAPEKEAATPERPAQEPADRGEPEVAGTPDPGKAATTTTTPVEKTPTDAPARPTVKRGDLVEPGTPGLKDPQLISLRKVPYPPLARRNRVEGLVIVRALVSEDGKVLETELLRGVSQNVGLNEAALDMVKGGRFQPGTVGNVAVRAWKTIPIPFKME